ncbi:MAG: hypothetical protein IJR13_00700 [Bacteroidales bacterium]|nr:hypothetical protein [Bacteroidales bacterium]
MKRYFFLVIILCIITHSALGQEQRRVWSLRLNVRTNSLLIPVCYRIVFDSKLYEKFSARMLEYLNSKAEQEKNSRIERHERTNDETSVIGLLLIPYIFPPNLEYDIHTPNWELYDHQDMIETGKPYIWRNLLFGDYSHNYNYAIGATFSLHPRHFPLSFSLGANWESRALYITDGEMSGKHRSAGFVPHFFLSYHFVDNDNVSRDCWDFTCNIGTSFVHILEYDGPLEGGKDNLSDGLRGQVGVSLQHGFEVYSIRYEWDFYNYFNIPDITTRMNSLVFSYCLNFGAAHNRLLQ